MTGEEYEQIRSASEAQGARCLSDFARKVLLRAVRPRDDRTVLERRIEAIEKRVAGLGGEMGDLSLSVDERES